jgi:xylan 1,4-beta-xylosidase
MSDILNSYVTARRGDLCLCVAFCFGVVFCSPGRTYKFYTGDAVYPFGHGLTYTTFDYQIVDAVRPSYDISELITNAVRDDRLKDIALTVNVTNTGKVASSVSVLAFVNSSAAFVGITPPIRELFDYARVRRLAPGATVELIFGLSYRVLSHVDQNGHAWLLPGTYTVTINNEKDVVSSFELKGQPMLVEDFPAPSNPAPVAPVSLSLNKHTRSIVN